MAYSRIALQDLNDLLKPTPACIPNTDSENSSIVPIQGSVTRPIYQDASLGVARVPLKDCLSCSGCLTNTDSAWTISNSTFSLEEETQWMNWLANNDSGVVSLTPQSIASIALAWGLDYTTTAQKIATLLKRQGVHYVTDIREGRWFTWMQLWETLQQRYRDHNQLPLIISTCPVWLSLLQRKKREWLTNSFQGYDPLWMTGYLWRQLKQARHWTVVSCEQVKLQMIVEMKKAGETSFVDGIWTTQQLMHYISQWLNNAKLDSIECSALDELFNLEKDYCQGTSNGYFWMMVERWIDELGSQLEHVEWQDKKQNNNYQQVWMTWRDKTTDERHRVTMIMAYGYPNLQKLIRMKDNDELIFIEAMACTFGCVNGNGQLQQPQTPKERQEMMQWMEQSMSSRLSSSQWKQLCNRKHFE
eukprot:jgi/Galph1/2424/GphlegSOOS_G1113.1